MRILHARAIHCLLAWRGVLLFATSLLALHLLLVDVTFSQPQPRVTPTLLVTPNATTLLVGETATLSAVDETGRPITNVRWSINSDVVTVQEQDGEVFLQGRAPGRATLTATANHQSDTAVISVLEGQKLAPPTVRWSLHPMPGFETLAVVQAAPGDNAPAFYSVEWSKSENAIVRALRVTGEQVWMTHLSSSGSPSTLKRPLPVAGEVFENGVLMSDQSVFILGVKNAFIVTGPSDPSALGFPPDGKSLLVHATRDAAGGILLLERGRFRDSLVDLNPADGSESWRYRSAGRLASDWTANENMDIGIVETLSKPVSSALLILNAETGQVSSRIAFPVSSSTIDGFRCTDPQRNVLKSLRPSPTGSVLTSNDGNIYVQVETHVESLLVEGCESKRYSFDDRLALLSVNAEGDPDWKTFQRVHADGEGEFVAQSRVFAGETIPDGSDGVLAAWTYLSPDTSGGQIRSEARLSRIGPSRQRDFTLPMPYWANGLKSFFDANMLLGEGNVLYAINGAQLLRFNPDSGEVNWVRRPPDGAVKMHYATVGGGLVVSTTGRLANVDAQGKGVAVPWTVQVANPADIGLVQTDPWEGKPLPPLQLRDEQLCRIDNFIAVEEGAPNGRGTLLYFVVR